MSLDRRLQRLWYGGFHPALLILVPLSWLFAALSGLRRTLFRLGVLRSHRIDAPVIVIGNITVGGTGKTPFTIWLAERLSSRGVRVGIILRGYGGSAATWPQRVTRETPWQEVGDEACLLAQRTDAIVVAGPDRVADAKLARELGALVILSDDGLQHYRLRRDLEIVVIDGDRVLGNGRLLPAGPLREPESRLRSVHLLVVSRRAAGWSAAMGAEGTPSVNAWARIDIAVNLLTREVRPLESFSGTSVHAIAAIGHPEAFFGALQSAGLDVRAHPHADHASLAREHIDFPDDFPVLMTEKDAVKCGAIADERHWAVPLEVSLNDADTKTVMALVERTVSNL